MNVLELSYLVSLRVAGDPALYAAAPFLEPMKSAAMTVAAKFGGHCTKCQKKAQRRASQQVSSAMAALILTESTREGSRLPALKDIVRKILNTQFDEVMIRYLKDGKELTFQF